MTAASQSALRMSRSGAIVSGVVAVGCAVVVVTGASAQVPVTRLDPVQDVVSRLLAYTGAGPVECGRHLRPGWANPPTPDLPGQWLMCVREAARENRPFFLLMQGMGIDSWVASGLVGGADGVIRQFAYDSDPMGGAGAPPNFRIRSCPLPNVVINPDGWAAITCEGGKQD